MTPRTVLALPHNPDAERFLLSACMGLDEAARDAVERLAPDAFWDSGRRAVFDEVRRLVKAQQPVDPASVAEGLHHSRADKAAFDALADVLADGQAPVPRSYPVHLKILEERAYERTLAAMASGLLGEIENGSRPNEIARLVGELGALRPPAEMASAVRVVPGGRFALDAPATPPAIWGEDDVIGWAAGEALLVVGPPGVGKTTLAQRLVLARIGLRSPYVLGKPVTPSGRRALYVAADRPRQAQRSLARMVSEVDRAALDERLAVWSGPLDFDVGARPESLLELARAVDVDTVVLDSAKDVCLDLTKDDAGSRFVRAWSLLLQEGIEVMVVHHQRKSSGDNRHPKKLDDVYGSAWLTAGAGSVVILWGDAGDPVLDLFHLKPPGAGELGPLRVLIDKDLGEVEVEDGGDLLGILRRAPNGLTAREAGRALYGEDDDPRKRTREKRAERELKRLCDRGLAHRRDEGRRVGEAHVRYFAVSRAVPQEVLAT